MLTVHRLLGDTEPRRDVLPGPASGTGIANLQDLELLGQDPQGRDRPKPDIGVVARDVVSKLRCHRHARQHELTLGLLSTHADAHQPVGQQPAITYLASGPLAPALARNRLILHPPVARAKRSCPLERRGSMLRGMTTDALSRTGAC